MQKDVILNNGVAMPRIGLGTFRAKGKDVQAAVQAAVQSGIRLIDTASIYKNEEDIRKAIGDTPGLFLTSKISPYEQGGKAVQAGNAILERLGRVDLLLMHWPGVARMSPTSPRNREERHATWRVMEEMYKAGKVRAIGVSNFGIAQLRDLLEIAEVYPAVNQVEIHPCYQQISLRDFCNDKGIVVTAYASLGCGTLLSRPEVHEAAKAHIKTPAQVLLKWGLQSGCTVIPKSIQTLRIAEYSEEHLLNWELSASSYENLSNMQQESKICWDAEGVA